MKLVFKPTPHQAIYLMSLVSSIAAVHMLMRDFGNLEVVFLGLVSMVGWFHFLRLVVISRNISFDSKMVWFISIFTFFLFAAPLFLLFVVNKKYQIKNE